MSSSIGKEFTVTTFGESHGKAMGLVVDGVPAGLRLSESDLLPELRYRRTGNYLVSGRREEDRPTILSGVYSGRTTGSPVAIAFENEDAISSLYSEVGHIPRPGHADLTNMRKYGRENWDYRGSGRASARETISRVAAGAIAKKLLMAFPTQVGGYLRSIGPLDSGAPAVHSSALESRKFMTRAIDSEYEAKFKDLIMDAMKAGNSYGGTVEAYALNPPQSLGEPVFDKLKADLAKAVMSLPAATGFEYGMGFGAASMKGSEAADAIILDERGELRLKENKSGGMLGGISTGEDIVIRCSFKPTSSIRIPAESVDIDTMKPAEISVKGRHDPVVAVRGVSVVEAMMAITLVDHAMQEGLIPKSRLPEELSGTIEGRWQEFQARYQ